MKTASPLCPPTPSEVMRVQVRAWMLFEPTLSERAITSSIPASSTMTFLRRSDAMDKLVKRPIVIYFA